MMAGRPQNGMHGQVEWDDLTTLCCSGAAAQLQQQQQQQQQQPHAVSGQSRPQSSLGEEIQGDLLNQLMIKVPPGLLLFLGWLAFIQTNGELFSRFSTLVLLFLTAEYLHFVFPHLLFSRSESSSRRTRSQGSGAQVDPCLPIYHPSTPSLAPLHRFLSLPLLTLLAAHGELSWVSRGILGLFRSNLMAGARGSVGGNVRSGFTASGMSLG